jgi:hypothetical protein
MWQDVPNRGGRVTIGLAERSFGDIGLSTRAGRATVRDAPRLARQRLRHRADREES